jgi:2',3'-cyclic-nucleotide 2'-phosphodiesterase/3'-nucleotidase
VLYFRLFQQMTAEEGIENAAIPLAQVDGIDAILTGHNHLIFPSSMYANFSGVHIEAGTIGGKPGGKGGFWGNHVGLLDLLIERDGSEWRMGL